MKDALAKFLTLRSPIRDRQYPSRLNTIKAVLLVLVAAPLSPLLSLLLAVRRWMKGRLRLVVVNIDNEFGHFVEVMERTRLKFASDMRADVIIVLSRFRFSALAFLYERAFQRSIWFGGGLRSLWLQIILLQPKNVIETHWEGHEAHTWMRETRIPLELTDELVRLRQKCLRDIGCRDSGYVAMAVYSMKYDEERAPAQLSKSRIMESHGDELASGVDYLRSRGLDVIMLGSPDVGRSHVPRDLPRLSDFGRLGGPHEVALASGCDYFWSDNVGAWWLACPFMRPVLCTNDARPLSNASYVAYHVQYRSLDGELLTWRQLLHREIVEGRAPMKDAAKGNLVMVKNSPEEIISAHEEMIRRVAGSYVEDAHTENFVQNSIPYTTSSGNHHRKLLECSSINWVNELGDSFDD